MQPDQSRKAVFFLALGLLGVGFSAPLARYLPGMAALAIAFWRMASASLMLWGFSAVRPRGTLPPRSLARIGLAGVFLAFHFACFYAAVKRVPIANATLFASVVPLIALLYERLVLHRKLDKGALVGVWIALLGMFVIQSATLDLESDHALGNLLALASSVFMAAVLILAENIRGNTGNIVYTRWLYLVAAATLALLAWAFDVSLAFEAGDIKWILALAILPTLLGHNSMNYAVKFIRPTFVGAMPLGEPVLASILAWILFGESLAAMVLAGGLITLCGLAIISLKRK